MPDFQDTEITLSMKDLEHALDLWCHDKSTSNTNVSNVRIELAEDHTDTYIVKFTAS